MANKTAGKLTTHVLDTANGCPAAGVELQLYRLENDQAHCLTKTITNSDGRTDSPLLTPETMVAGLYELRFWVGDYFAAQATPQATFSSPIPFLDLVPIRFGIADAAAHYHVPLLVSPWSYSTYRGS
ncbi:MAG: hydroxyisourate hydrolase [Cyanobacteria bacterium P01_D01_bin.156]